MALAPSIGRDFFPTVDAGQFRLHVRAPAGTRIEETERIFGQVEDVIREVVPAHERELILDNMGMSPSFTVRAYIDNGTVSNADGEILVSLKEEHSPTAEYVAQAARGAAPAVPRLHILLPAGRYHQPDPQLRPARADQRAGRGRQRRGQPGRRQEAATRSWRRSPASRTFTSTRSPTSRPYGSTWTGSWRRSWGSASRTWPAACWCRSARPARRRRTTGSTRSIGSITCWPCRRPPIASTRSTR